MRLQTGLTLAAALALAGCGPAGADESTAAAAAATRPDSAPTPAATGLATYHSADLGVAFARGAGLEARPCEGETGRCLVVVDPTAAADQAELYTVRVFDGPLEVVAAAEAGFERNDQGQLMTTYGRFEPVAVESFRSGDLEGLRAVVACGISDPETGFHAAAGECLWAVVSDGARSAVIASGGYADGLEAAEAAARSLTFQR